MLDLAWGCDAARNTKLKLVRGCVVKEEYDSLQTCIDSGNTSEQALGVTLMCEIEAIFWHSLLYVL